MKKGKLFCILFFLMISLNSGYSSPFYFGFGPKLLINTDSYKNSAPNPVSFSGELGGIFLEDKAVSIDTSLSFFTNYYLWDGTARPAEIENRTALVLSFIADLTAGHTWFIGHGAKQDRKDSIQANAGAAVLIRHGLLANGVSAADANPKTGTSAKTDLENINSSFFKGYGFIYPEIIITYMHKTQYGHRFGAEFKTYFPLENLVNGDGFNSGIFSLSLRVQP